jgi:hypothetical protein
MTEDEKEVLLARLKAAPTASVVKIHKELKDREGTVKGEMEAKLAPILERRALVSLALLDHLNRAGAQNIKTPEGTVFIYTQKTMTIVDGEALWKWARDNDAGDVFQSRVNISAVEGHNETNPDNPVAGLHSESIISARVRAK